MKKCFGYSLGCKVNAYETEALLSLLKREGYNETSLVKEADLILINTCAVTLKAAAKSRQHIRRFRKENPNAILIVMGCYSKEAKDNLLTLGADIVLGTENRTHLLEDIHRYEKEKKSFCDVSSVRKKTPFEDLAFEIERKTTRRYLKIQDGCDKFCSYCAIPSLRGPSRSRLPESIFYEVKKLIEVGTKEIVLSGVEIGNYGLDLDDDIDLGKLLNELLTLFPSLPRLRISSMDISEITPSFLEAYKKFPNLMPHFHLSLQSGSKSVLERMRRHYSPKEYLLGLNKLREIRPETAITTDIIVGFPLESEEEWKETLDFAKEAKFAEIHVFPFSPRKGTYAASLKEIDSSIKEKRVQELLSLSKELRDQYEKSFYGEELEVLFESFDKKNKFAYGHTKNYLLVKTPSNVSLEGQFKNIIYNELTKAD